MATKKDKKEEKLPLSGELLEKLLSSDGFSYNVNGDELYRKYRDDYLEGGRLAMKDTVGQASALTGGYGNSYAVAAGQQAYGAYAAKAADKIPELYRLALERYERDRRDLTENYGLLLDRETASAAAERQDRLDRESADRAERELALKAAAQRLAEEKEKNASSLARDKFSADVAYRDRTQSEVERSNRANESLARDKFGADVAYRDRTQSEVERRNRESESLARDRLDADVAYHEGTLSAKERADYYDYLLRAAKQKAGEDPLKSLNYGKLGVSGAKDLDSLVKAVRSEAKKAKSADGANARVAKWIGEKREAGLINADQADLLWFFMRFYESDFA